MKKMLCVLLIMGIFIAKAFALHEHIAPHQGALIVLGEELAHLELVLDSKTGVLTAYSLDGEAENAVPLAMNEIQIIVKLENENMLNLFLKAVENPLTGEKLGSTSEFSIQNDMLKGVEKFSGNIVAISTKGQDFNNVDFEFPEGNEHHEQN